LHNNEVITVSKNSEKYVVMEKVTYRWFAAACEIGVTTKLSVPVLGS
jgi:hypothetical protein